MLKFKASYLIVFYLCILSTYGQQVISGRVIGEDLEIPMGIKVYDKDTIELGKTNFNGYFKIKASKHSEKLIFAGLGYEWTEIIILKNCDTIEAVLLKNATYDYRSSNKIDRLRKKRFDKLTDLHSTAFQNGFFKTEKPCIKREFQPIKSRLDKIGRQKDLTKEQIKSTFKELEIGNVVKVPSEAWSAYTSETDFGCVITSTIVGKNKKKRSYNLILKVTNNMCGNKQATYNGKKVNIGDSITYNMKYYKIISDDLISPKGRKGMTSKS